MAATDNSNTANKLVVETTWPAKFATAVTPDDNTDLTYVSRGIYVGVTGDLVVEMEGDVATSKAAITFVGVLAGSVLPIRVSRVRSTGTTAESILDLY